MVWVLVMLIWGYVEGSFEHSWLAVMAAGICMAAISMIRKIRLFYRIDTKNDRIDKNRIQTTEFVTKFKTGYRSDSTGGKRYERY